MMVEPTKDIPLFLRSFEIVLDISVSGGISASDFGWLMIGKVSSFHSSR